MRDVSHGQQTFITALRTAVAAWRKREGWSRETVVQIIVETHERAGYDRLTGVMFDPETRDPVERMKVNADRVYRWLDDESKDTNLLSANLLPTMLLALPADLRLCVAEALLGRAGLTASFINTGDDSASIPSLIGEVSRECAESAAALADLIDATDKSAASRTAGREIEEAIAALNKAKRVIGRSEQ